MYQHQPMNPMMSSNNVPSPYHPNAHPHQMGGPTPAMSQMMQQSMPQSQYQSSMPMHPLHPQQTNPSQSQPPTVQNQWQPDPPFDPVATIKQLVSVQLKQHVSLLMKSAAELVRNNAKVTHANNVLLASQADTSKPLHDKPSPEAFHTALDNFYSVCDQIETQFMLINDCQQHSRLFDKYLPLQIKDDTPQPPNSVSYPQYLSLLKQHIDWVHSLSQVFENCAESLSVSEAAHSQPQENEPNNVNETNEEAPQQVQQSQYSEEEMQISDSIVLED